MKRILPLVLLTLLHLTACAAPESPPLSEALKISTFLYQKEISETLDCHTASLESLNALDTSKIEFTALTLGEERMIAHEGYNDTVGLNFRFEYDGGIIEVVSENKDVQMSTDEKCRLFIEKNRYGERRYGYSARISNAGYISLVPLGGCGGMTEIDNISVFAMEYPRCPGHRGNGTEYIITVNAYDGDDIVSPTISAKLRLTHLGESDAVPYTSNFCSVELISYDYSDVYIIMDAEQ